MPRARSRFGWDWLHLGFSETLLGGSAALNAGARVVVRSFGVGNSGDAAPPGGSGRPKRSGVAGPELSQLRSPSVFTRRKKKNRR